MNLGKQIRLIRQLRELSQEYLGNETGIGQEGISRIENNKISPNYCQLLKIATVLQVKLSFLLQFNTEDLLNELHMRRLDEIKKRGGDLQRVCLAVCATKWQWQ